MFGVLDTPPLCCRVPNTGDMPCVSILTLSGAGSSQGGNGLHFDTNVWVEIVEPPEGTIDRCSDQGPLESCFLDIGPLDPQHEGDHHNPVLQACEEAQDSSWHRQQLMRAALVCLGAFDLCHSRSVGAAAECDTL